MQGHNKFNIYWYSHKKARHSKVIENNPEVAHVITDIKELVHGIVAYGKKMLKTKFVNSKQAMKKFVKQYTDFKGKSPLRMYKASPTKVWKLAPTKVYNDKYVDERVEVDLS